MVSLMVSGTEAHGFTHALADVRQIKAYVCVGSSECYLDSCRSQVPLYMHIHCYDLPLKYLGFICSMIGSVFSLLETAV